MPRHGTDTEDRRPIARSPSTASHKFRSCRRLAHCSHRCRNAFISTPVVPCSPPRPHPVSATPLDTSRSRTTTSFSSTVSCVLPLPAMVESQPVTMAHRVATTRWRATAAPDFVTHNATLAEQGAKSTALHPSALPALRRRPLPRPAPWHPAPFLTIQSHRADDIRAP
jgi:hypothetical protein